MSPRRPVSLRTRLVATLGATLVAACALAVLGLDALYRDLGLRARRDVLEAQVIALVAAAELDAGGNLAPTTLAEPRLATPGSGLYAQIRDGQGTVIWRSPSTAGSGLALAGAAQPGERRFETARLPDGTRLLALDLGVSWETPGRATARFVLSAAESLEPYYAEVARVRLFMIAGATVLALLLLAVLVGALGVAVRPLRRLQREIGEVESGGRDRLEGPWPPELAGVTAGLNALLATERERLERYRATLGNLAHSLKTPLAALRGLVEAPGVLERGALGQQLDRMQDIVEHQLKRAVVGGGAGMLAAVPVRPVLDDLRAALTKVYASQRVQIDVRADAAVAYPIDRGDLFEVAGNLLDNACKYGRGRVRLTARAVEGAGWRRPGLEICVEDDGPGIPPEQRLRVLERGARADERLAGQGIGLAVVRDIVAAYGGTVSLGEGPLGGARALVTLPGR